MKNLASKITLAGAALALVCTLVVPAVAAADAKSDTKAQQQQALQAKREAEALKKYDKNGNGVLDPEEQALRQANQDKMRLLREAKQKKAAERAAAAQGAAQTPAAAQPAPQN